MFALLVLFGQGNGVVDALGGESGSWQYVVVFVLASIPLLEVLVVVPPAIGLGLDPVLVGVFAFLGNAASAYGLIAFQQRVTVWWQRRRGGDDDEESGRFRRARRLWERFGLPGLALSAPVLTGTHIAAVVAMMLGARARSVAVWMTVGIGAWTLFLVVASVTGLSLLGFI
ncbi:hypothetical protein GCM10025298_35190 [Natronobiforma cellulositropha]